MMQCSIQRASRLASARVTDMFAAQLLPYLVERSLPCPVIELGFSCSAEAYESDVISKADEDDNGRVAPLHSTTAAPFRQR